MLIKFFPNKNNKPKQRFKKKNTYKMKQKQKKGKTIIKK